MSLDQAANTEAHLEHPAARLLSLYWRRFHQAVLVCAEREGNW